MSATPAAHAPDKPVLQGIVFDMDGTVTMPCIDFTVMRARCGVTTGDILDVINAYPAAEKAAAYNAIAEMEDEALVNMKLMPGAKELCAMLDNACVPRGLITRNVMRSVTYLHEQHIVHAGLAPFSPAVSRECRFEYKPSPEALLHICSTWGIPPQQAVMLGDSIKDDIVSGNRAGAVTILIDYNGMNGYRQETLIGERRPTHVVHSLGELQVLLTTQYTLQPPPNPHAAVMPMSLASEVA
eukprot:CAMPEP_0119103936 /NCGR_PEP_ID=MMETSP1180-20130426/2272_1 /TAXON_ID=3052 ORGANISM="Chlamydomonas cf sp, Strain CCMP681" /NCGR_SAMPLE_ID=MMETSP1180 /ASSEMBLY_ACC=CAM_ASM_000741 /LENGTH=240 /DNA_ID=CAMNT_0007088561 /DNA_START=114 /DNA_END=836 /DNA_ORIENTATION=-